MSEVAWVPRDDVEDPKCRMLHAAAEIADTACPVGCPLCRKGKLRFFYHEVRIERKPVRRGGTIWAWCVACRRWTHLSGITVAEPFSQPIGAISDEVIEVKEKRGELIDWLNEKWEEGSGA